MSESLLKNRVALVTGASRGIGLAVAKRLKTLGAQVISSSRTRSKNNFIEADLSKTEDIEELVEKIKTKYGKLDILINNAGMFTKTAFEKLSEAEWDQVLDLNLKAPFLLSQAAFKLMPKGGSIVNVSSLAGVRGYQKFKDYVPYIVSKFGVVGLTEALAEEGRRKGIHVNCVAPGAVETDMLKLFNPHLKTNAMPEDMAEVVVRVAELGLGVLTGSVIEVPTAVWRDD